MFDKAKRIGQLIYGVPLAIFWGMVAVVKIFRAGQPTDELLQELTSDDWKVVLHGLYYLKRRRGKKVVVAIIPILEHENAQNRREAAYRLGECGDRIGLEPLKTALAKESDENAKIALLWALERLN